MERLTGKFGDKVVLPIIPMEIKNQSDLEGFHKVRKKYEENTIKLAEYEDIGLSPEEVKQFKDAEEQGLLLRLPCGIGADVYFIPSETNYKLNILQDHPESNRVYHQNVERITFTPNGWYLECNKDLEYATDHILIDKLYKETWFLSQSEAEQKLNEMESD